MSDPPALARATFSQALKMGAYANTDAPEHSLVPEGHYFILAENATEIPDSRALGWIARRDIIGPVAAVWWPLWRARRVKR